MVVRLAGSTTHFSFWAATNAPQRSVVTPSGIVMLSAAQQIYLYGLLGYEAPRFAHVPLLCAPDGRRLSKRDASLGMESMRRTHSPEEIIGILAQLAGLREDAAPCTAASLLDSFDLTRIVRREKIILTGLELLLSGKAK